MADLFAEDLVFDLGGGHDAAPIIGRDAALQAVQSSIVDAVTVHQVHSPEFDINGDEARVVWAARSRAAAELEKVCLAEPMADPLSLAVDARRAAVTSTGLELADIKGLSTYPGPVDMDMNERSGVLYERVASDMDAGARPSEAGSAD